MATETPNTLIAEGENNTLFQTNVSDMSRYMRFIGILYIIGGAFYCLGIITAIIGVPVIIMGVRLREAADAFKNFATSGAFPDISLAVEKQRAAFLIMFVFAIIGLVFMAIYIVVMIGIVMSEL